MARSATARLLGFKIQSSRRYATVDIQPSIYNRRYTAVDIQPSIYNVNSFFSRNQVTLFVEGARRPSSQATADPPPTPIPIALLFMLVHGIDNPITPYRQYRSVEDVDHVVRQANSESSPFWDILCQINKVRIFRKDQKWLNHNSFNHLPSLSLLECRRKIGPTHRFC